MKGSRCCNYSQKLVREANMNLDNSGNGERMPTNNELASARFQGAVVARVVLKLKRLGRTISIHLASLQRYCYN